MAVSRSRLGAYSAILRALREKRFTALVTVPLMLEYEAVLLQPEHLPEHLIASQRRVDQTVAFPDAFFILAEPVHLHYLLRPQLRNPADEMVLETALNGRAEGLVTLNVRGFVPAERFRLAVLTPAAFLAQLREEKT